MDQRWKRKSPQLSPRRPPSLPPLKPRDPPPPHPPPNPILLSLLPWKPVYYLFNTCYSRWRFFFLVVDRSASKRKVPPYGWDGLQGSGVGEGSEGACVGQQPLSPLRRHQALRPTKGEGPCSLLAFQQGCWRAGVKSGGPGQAAILDRNIRGPFGASCFMYKAWH